MEGMGTVAGDNPPTSQKDITKGRVQGVRRNQQEDMAKISWSNTHTSRGNSLQNSTFLCFS